MAECNAMIIDVTSGAGYTSGSLAFGVTVEDCEYSDVTFTVMLTYLDGRKQEVQLSQKSGGEKSFTVKHEERRPVKEISDAYGVKCTCVG